MKRRNKVGICCLLVALTFAFVPGLLAAEAGPVDKVNINEATLEELAGVKFIGPTIAERIVKYRESSGPFSALEDLMKVKGIGQKTFEKIKDGVTL